MQSKLAGQHIQAKNFTAATARLVTLVVLHTDEANERPDNAENVARFFAGQPKVPPAKTGSSAHYCCDNNSIVSCVDETDVAWGAPHVNHNGVHIEQSGDASQRAAGWADEFSQTMIKTQVAPLVADVCKRHGLPVKHLTNDELRRGAKGIIGHVQASTVFGGTHTDPGSDYPWPLLISKARLLVAVKKWKLVMLDGEGLVLAKSLPFELKDEEKVWQSFTKAKRKAALAELGDAATGRDVLIRRVAA